MPTSHYSFSSFDVVHTDKEEEITIVAKEIDRRPDGSIQINLDKQDILGLYEVLKDILTL